MDTRADFNKRLGTLERQHKKLANGYTTKMLDDGLIVIRPKLLKRPSLKLSAIVPIVLGFFLFKAFVLTWLGTASYDDRVTLLASGSLFEQAGAWAMQADPLTSFLAGIMGQLV